VRDVAAREGLDIAANNRKSMGRGGQEVTEVAAHRSTGTLKTVKHEWTQIRLIGRSVPRSCQPRTAASWISGAVCGAGGQFREVACARSRTSQKAGR
jgi:hypothetical protein